MIAKRRHLPGGMSLYKRVSAGGRKGYTMFFLAGVFLLISAWQCKATHLIGGSITYKYIGQANAKIMYRITVDMFRDCDTPSTQPSPTPFDPVISLGVYERRGNAFGDTPLVTTMNMSLASDTHVDPPSGAKNCTFKPRSCIREGLYNDTLFVDPSSYGYYLVFTRCCRNIMLNVPDNEGQTYFAIIPPTSIINSSPVFNAVPSPYICANDTVSLSYNTVEADGDSLAYSLDQPLAGGNVSVPMPSPASNFTGVPLVSYKSGYSPAYPMSSFGFADIDPYTGVVTLYAPGVGRYAIAVAVREYRNNTLISITRRDIQIITVSGCPKSYPPYRTPIIDSLPIDNSTTNVFKVEAGHRLSFNIRYKAYNSKVNAFTASGFFNNTGYTHKPAFSFVIDSPYVTAYFNWQTACKDGSASPYTFTVAASDLGCPPKTTYEGYKVYVTKGSDHIDGDLNICKTNSVNIYSTNTPRKGDTLEWFVAGGSYARGPNDSSITINWGKSSAGQIKVVSENDVGCKSDTIVIKVKIWPKPDPAVIIGPRITCSGILNFYSVAGYNKPQYHWIIKGGTIVDTDATNKHITVLWNLGVANLLSIWGIDSNGCLIDTVTIPVLTKLPTPDTILGRILVCPNTTTTYSVTPKPSAIYHWKIEGGRLVSIENSPQITVEWGGKGTGMVKIFEELPNGCPGDTSMLMVTKDFTLKISPIIGDSSLCEFTGPVKYSVTGIDDYAFSWGISGGKIVNGNGAKSIIVNWGSAGRGLLTVTESYIDPVNNQGCGSAPDSLFVRLRPIPNPSEISGPLNLCENDSAFFKVKGSTGTDFTWTINGITSPVTADSLYVGMKGLKKLVDTLRISVTENTDDSCPGPTRFMNVVLYKIPITTAITGPAVICAPNLGHAQYEVTWKPNAIYKWTVDGGSITSGIGTNKIMVDWQIPGMRKVSVREYNEFGCPGPIVALDVIVDSLTVDMQLVTTEEANDKVINVFWSHQNDTFFNGYYKIYRSAPGQNYFMLIDSVPKTSTFYVDKKVKTDAYAYRYKVQAVNRCGQPVTTKIHRSIRLTGNYDGDTLVHLNWNPYTGWPVEKYNLRNSQNDDTSMQVFGFSNDTSYLVIKTLEGYRQCFRIAAKKAGLNNVISWSNKVCVDYDPILWIPNVFTPNGDIANENYHVFVANFKTYQLDIYNRWGEHIYQSNDPKAQWDGKFKGEECIEGVYLYIINVGGIRKNIYRSGTVTLLR